VSQERYHTEFLGAQSFSETAPEQQLQLRTLIEEQVRLAKSSLATRMLENWTETSEKFVLFTPKPQA
jgi:glutamate synthase domain-containing protein 3